MVSEMQARFGKHAMQGKDNAETQRSQRLCGEVITNTLEKQVRDTFPCYYFERNSTLRIAAEGMVVPLPS